MRIVGTALTIALLGALGGGTAGISLVAAATAAPAETAAAAFDDPMAAAALGRSAFEAPAAPAHDGNADADAEDEDDDATTDGATDRTPTPKSEAMLDRLAAILDRLVTAGTITAAQKQAILDAAAGDLAKPERSRAGTFHFTGAVFTVVREYLGVTQKEIAANAKAGRSLADLAVAKGKTRDGLILAIVATVKEPTAATAEAVGKLVDAKGRLSAGRSGESAGNGAAKTEEHSKANGNARGKAVGRRDR